MDVCVSPPNLPLPHLSTTDSSASPTAAQLRSQTRPKPVHPRKTPRQRPHDGLRRWVHVRHPSLQQPIRRHSPSAAGGPDSPKHALRILSIRIPMSTRGRLVYEYCPCKVDQESIALSPFRPVDLHGVGRRVDSHLADQSLLVTREDQLESSSTMPEKVYESKKISTLTGLNIGEAIPNMGVTDSSKLVPASRQCRP